MKVLKNLQDHLKESGAIPRDHGNCGFLPPNAFSYNRVECLVKFVAIYATVYGLLQPAACRGRGGTAPIYLPASQTYTTVHQLYLQACAAEEQPSAIHFALYGLSVFHTLNL